MNWTREEHLLAFNLYCRLPFGRMHKGNPEVIELARMIGRTPSSVAMMLTNFARLDPALQARGVRGMGHGAGGEVEVWAEFAQQPEALAFESERLLAARLGQPLETVAEIDTRDLPPVAPESGPVGEPGGGAAVSFEGREREALVRLRVNQSFFRRRILSAYDFRCCVTGLSARDSAAARELLVASHIVPSNVSCGDDCGASTAWRVVVPASSELADWENVGGAY